MNEVPMIDTRINGRWSLKLPEHRAVRPEWETGWERERLDSMHHHLSRLVHEMLDGPITAAPDGRPLIVDVGVEEGDLTALYSQWGCDVVMVEPNPKVWPNIRAIWTANDLRHPVEWWVGFAGDVTTTPAVETSWAHEHVGEAWEMGGWPSCSFGPVIGDHAFLHLAQHPHVPSIRLDDLMERQKAARRKVDAITMDVEGSELRVLRGAFGILLADRPLVWVSVHTDDQWMAENYAQDRRADIDQYMHEVHYVAEHLATDHEEHVFYRPEEYS